MPSKEDYKAMHDDAMASLSAIEDMQRGLSQLTGNIQRLANFSSKFLEMDDEDLEEIGKKIKSKMDDSSEEEDSDEPDIKKGMIVSLRKRIG